MMVDPETQKEHTMKRMMHACLALMLAVGALWTLSAAVAAAAPMAGGETEYELQIKNPDGSTEVKRGEDKDLKPGIAAKALSNGGSVLSGVQLLGEGCHSAGANEEEVVTNPLVETLGWINAAKGEVGVEERAKKKKALFAAFTCGSTDQVELRGAAVGLLEAPLNTPLAAGSALVTDIALTESGEQLYPSLEGKAAVAMEMQVNKGGFHPVGWADREKLEFLAAYEVSTATGTPRFVKVKKHK